MTEQGKLVSGLGFAAWGYLFLILNVDIYGWELLPNFVGYGLLLAALGRLAGRPQPDYLRGLCLGLLLANLLNMVSGYELLPAGSWLFVLYVLADVWLRFDLLAVMSALAADYQPAGVKLDKDIMSYGVFGTCLQLAAFLGLFYTFLADGALLAALGGSLLGLLVVLCLFRLRKIIVACDFSQAK